MASEIKLPLVVADVAAALTDTYWFGGRGTFIVEATAWGGGSVVLQYQSPVTTWINADPTAATFTANGMCNFELPPGRLRALVTTATGVNVYAIGTRIV